MEIFNTICQNPWCKGMYTYTENDFIKTEDGLKAPTQCPKCKSFSNELSGGVEWKDKIYEGNRWDNQYHEMRYKVTNYK